MILICLFIFWSHLEPENTCHIPSSFCYHVLAAMAKLSSYILALLQFRFSIASQYQSREKTPWPRIGNNYGENKWRTWIWFFMIIRSNNYNIIYFRDTRFDACFPSIWFHLDVYHWANMIFVWHALPSRSVFWIGGPNNSVLVPPTKRLILYRRSACRNTVLFYKVS